MNCKNCGKSIELVNYALGPQWMHNPPGYTGHKMGGGEYNVFRHCRTAVAEPTEAADMLDAAALADIDRQTREMERHRAQAAVSSSGYLT